MNKIDKFIDKFTSIVWAALTCFCVLVVAGWFALEVISSFLGVWYK